MKIKHLSLVLALWIIQSVSFAGDTCHPSLSPTQQNYMIGYGSLMQQASRTKTTPSAINAYPIEVKGFQRSWGIHGGHFATTFLTLTTHATASLNAVYYALKTDGVLSTDRRESGYCRAEVPMRSITPLGLKSLPVGKYWIYTQRDDSIEKPNSAYPIVQSYVDIFIGGCIDVGKTYRLRDFKTKCTTETVAWPKNKGDWINDRVHARRPFYIPHVFAIDKLLSSHFDDYYKHPYA